MARYTYYKETENHEPEVVSISEAKQLIKEKGGYAYTLHTERDGTVFERTEVKLDNNNSSFKYNRHL